MALFACLISSKIIKIFEYEQENNNVVETYKIKFPFHVNLYKINSDEEDKPTELDGIKAYEYLTKDDIEGVCYDFEIVNYINIGIN